MDFVYLNQHFVPQGEALIPISDRGFRFGDGIFETIRVVNGVPYQWEYHLNRLERGLTALHISLNTSGLSDISRNLIAKNQLRNGFLRIAVSRGSGSKGFLPIASTPTLVIETLPEASPPESPVALWLSSYRKIPGTSLPIHIKTMQGLQSTLARMEAEANHCHEALLLGQNDHICEGSSSNIFWVSNGILYTPSPQSGILSGSVREAAIWLSPLPVEQGLFSLDALKTADEVFITNVAWLILPVSSLQPLGYTWEKHNFAHNLLSLLKEEMERYAHRHA